MWDDLPDEAARDFEAECRVARGDDYGGTAPAKPDPGAEALEAWVDDEVKKVIAENATLKERLHDALAVGIKAGGRIAQANDLIAAAEQENAALKEAVVKEHQRANMIVEKLAAAERRAEKMEDMAERVAALERCFLEAHLAYAKLCDIPGYVALPKEWRDGIAEIERALVVPTVKDAARRAIGKGEKA